MAFPSRPSAPARAQGLVAHHLSDGEYDELVLVVRHEVALEVRRQLGLRRTVTILVHAEADGEVVVAPEVPPPARPAERGASSS